MLKDHLRLTYFYKYIALILLLASGQMAFSNDTVRIENAWDERSVEFRHPSDPEIDAYKTNSDYKYDRFQNPESLWDIFKRWVWSFFRGNSVSEKIVKYILYGLAIITFVIIILVLFGIRIKGLFMFSRNAKNQHPNFAINTDNIHDTKLSEMLRMYIETGALREATRVMYLLVLRGLDDRHFIRWQTGKTNFDYYYELPNPELKQEFKKLVVAYEYVWYGEFPLSGSQFDEIRKQYEALSSTITNHRNGNGIKKA
jgi:hypothetical protein